MNCLHSYVLASNMETPDQLGEEQPYQNGGPGSAGQERLVFYHLLIIVMD